MTKSSYYESIINELRDAMNDLLERVYKVEEEFNIELESSTGEFVTDELEGYINGSIPSLEELFGALDEFEGFVSYYEEYEN